MEVNLWAGQPLQEVCVSAESNNNPISTDLLTLYQSAQVVGQCPWVGIYLRILLMFIRIWNNKGTISSFWVVKSLSLHACSAMSDSLQSWLTRLLCLWDFFLGKNIGVSCHFLLQVFFLTQGSNLHLLCLLHCKWILYPLSHREWLATLDLLIRKVDQYCCIVLRRSHQYSQALVV